MWVQPSSTPGDVPGFNGLEVRERGRDELELGRVRREKRGTKLFPLATSQGIKIKSIATSQSTVQSRARRRR